MTTDQSPPLDFDANVIKAIESQSLPAINEAIKQAFENNAASTKALMILGGDSTHPWITVAETLPIENRSDVRALFSAWRMNEAAGRDRDVQTLREAFSVCKSLHRVYGHTQSYEFYPKGLLGLAANSTEADALCWREKIKTVRVHLGQHSLQNLKCDVLESFSPTRELADEDHQLYIYGKYNKVRPHVLACLEFRDYGVYNDEYHDPSSYGYLHVARSKEDMDAWLAQTPSMQRQHAFMSKVSWNLEQWQRSQVYGDDSEPFELREISQAQVREFDRIFTMESELGRPITHACAVGSKEVVNQLIIAGAKPTRIPADGDGLSPIHCAAAGGQTEIIKLLVEQHGVDVNERDPQGRTPLMTAVQFRNAPSTLTLFELGADTQAITHDNRNLMDLLKEQRRCLSLNAQGITMPTEELMALIHAHQAKQIMTHIHSTGEKYGQRLSTTLK